MNQDYELLIGKTAAGRSCGSAAVSTACYTRAVVPGKPSASASRTLSLARAGLLDIKRELFQHHGRLPCIARPQGDPVRSCGPDGRSHRWNPFWQVDRQSARSGSIRSPHAPTSCSLKRWGQDNGNTDFWNAAAREAFCAVANCWQRQRDAADHGRRSSRVFLRGDADQWLRSDDRRRRGTRSSQPYTRAVVDGISGYLSADDKPRRLDRQDCHDPLADLVQSARRCRHECTDFDLRDIRRKNMAIYIGVSPGDIPRNAPLLRLFFDALLNVNTIEDAGTGPDAQGPYPACCSTSSPSSAAWIASPMPCNTSGATACASHW